MQVNKSQKQSQFQTLIIKILQQTQAVKYAESKTNAKNKTKYDVDMTENIKQIYNLSAKLENNKDKVSQFCQSELRKAKVVRDWDGENMVYQLEEIVVQSTIDMCSSYFRRQTSQKRKQQYIYLKIKQNIYIFNNAFIPSYKNPSQPLQITFILSQSPIKHILSYIQLCLHYNKIFKLIITENLWHKIKQVLFFFWTQLIIQILKEGKVVICDSDKIFDFFYENSSIVFRKNLWFWDSWNINIMLEGQNYMVEGDKIGDSEVIYSAWRKDIISQQQYCKLIDKNMSTNIKWSNKSQQTICKINKQCKYYLSQKQKIFNHFTNCQIFMTLPTQIIDEIYQSGHIIQYNKTQILYKSLTQLDNFFIVLEGKLGVIKQLMNKETGIEQIKLIKQLNVQDYFCLETLAQDKEFQRVSLEVRSETALVHIIPIWKMKFILGHFLQQIINISKFQLDQQFVKFFRQLNFSEYLIKCIKRDQENSQNFSQLTTKKICSPSIKMSNQLWKVLCHIDLRVFHQTC